MGTAALSMGWSRRVWRRDGVNAPGPMNPSGSFPVQGPSDPIGLTVEIFVNNAWTDISQYVYYRNLVRITRGRPDETSQVQPQTCTMTINNRDGRFSPRNPMGPYYGQIGRNTPLRVSRLQNGVRRYRFHGEVSSWPTKWDISGTDVYTDITASGILRRINQGAVSIGSAMYRAYALGETPSFGADLVVSGYWPCEDGSGSTSIASGLPGVTPMTVTGSPKFATNTAFACSNPIPVLNGSTWSAPVKTTSPWIDNVCRFLVQTPAGASGETDNEVLARIFTTGTVARLDFRYGIAGAGSFNIMGYDANGTLLFGPLIMGITGGVTGATLRVSFELRTSGSDILYELQAIAPGGVSGFTASGTLTSASVGAVTAVSINPDGTSVNTAIGHISIQPVWDTLFDLINPLEAWQGENPANRFDRLCPEQNINGFTIPFPQSVLGMVSNPTTMGSQLPDTFPNLINQIAATDLGLIFEATDQNALSHRTRTSLYNQGTVYNNFFPSLALDFAQHQLSASLNPIDDDLYTRNDITVSRINGSSARQQQTTGALNISPPPAGVGDYSTTASISIGDDSLLPDQAGWRLHMGTVDEPRYPQISMNLRNAQFTGNLTLMNQALTVDIGDRVTIANPPPWIPPDTITQIIQGYTETLGIWEHDIVLTCSPEDPYHVAFLDDAVLSTADTDGSTLVNSQTATATSFLVATTTSASPLWTTNAGDFPFDIAVSGERVTVTNITGASSPQTFTVTRSVNGVVKAQTAGTDVRLWQPMILSL